MPEIAIGIDLGTSNSCGAVMCGGKVDVLANAYGENTTASVVAFKADGTIAVGNAAKANIIHDPRHTVYSAKRLIGRYYFSEEVKKAKAICTYEIVEAENHSLRIKIRDELFSLPEIGAMVLREMKSIAEARTGQPLTKAVITVPANFNDNQRQATKDAGRIAGLDVLRILNEPTAAALAYGFGKGLAQRVAVYDLGGGTFDISVLEIGDDIFEVLSTCGDTFLGGDDFDDRVIDLLADEFSAAHGINLRNDPYALEKLKVAAEGAKKALSVDSEVEIRIPDVIRDSEGRPLSIGRTLGSQEFSTLVNDLIQRSFKVCDEALQQAGVAARDLDGVILVGGPTRLPVIREAVRQYFQQVPKAEVDPDQVVAMGAAIHAASLVGQEPEAYLLDVTPLSLRVGVAGGLAETVIERNTPVPIEQMRTFTTFQDQQESVKIRVYQGESRQSDENELLGQFEFRGFRKAPRGEVEIDISFEINADGIVNVTAQDRETGEEASTRITLSSGLSEGEIQEIIQEARTDRLEPAPANDDGSALAPVSEQAPEEEILPEALEEEILPEAPEEEILPEALEEEILPEPLEEEILPETPEEEILPEAPEEEILPEDPQEEVSQEVAQEVPQEDAPQQETTPESVAIGVIGRILQESAAAPPSTGNEGALAAADRSTLPIDLEGIPLETSDAPCDEADTAEHEAFAPAGEAEIELPSGGEDEEITLDDALEPREAADRGEQEPAETDPGATEPDLSLSDTDPCLFDAAAGEEGLFEDPGQDLSVLPGASDGEEKD
jgi:molecular chaperone DnaK